MTESNLPTLSESYKLTPWIAVAYFGTILLSGAITAIATIYASKKAIEAELEKAKSAKAEIAATLEPLLISQEISKRTLGHGLLDALGHERISGRIHTAALVGARISIFIPEGQCWGRATEFAKQLSIDTRHIVLLSPEAGIDFTNINRVTVRYFHKEKESELLAYEAASLIQGAVATYIEPENPETDRREIEVWMPRGCMDIPARVPTKLAKNS